MIVAKIIERIFDKLCGLIENSWGWLLSGGVFVFNFITPEKYSFIALGIAIAFDLLFGITAAVKQGKFFLSSAFRETPGKVLIYFGFLFVVYSSERVFGNGSFLITKGCSALGCGCELWSMLASALIIKPNMLFPRLLKLQLKGEIESKFGKHISNQFKDKEVNNDNTKGNPE